MKLSQGLTEKNRLARKIKEIQGRINTHNSFIKGNSKVYDTQKLVKELAKTTEELIAIKATINKANQPVQEKIFRLSELKSIAAFLKKLSIKEGKMQGDRWNQEICDWESDMGTVERDKLVEKYEKQISALQAELDEFNYATEIA